MKTSGNDQSAATRCSKHGRTAGGIFFRPEPYEEAVADYLCLHCWIEFGKPLQLSKEEFTRMRYFHEPPSRTVQTPSRAKQINSLMEDSGYSRSEAKVLADAGFGEAEG